MTDPEDTVTEREDDLVEEGVDLREQFERELPVEADDADAVDQKTDIPDDGEDDYR